MPEDSQGDLKTGRLLLIIYLNVSELQKSCGKP